MTLKLLIMIGISIVLPFIVNSKNVGQRKVASQNLTSIELIKCLEK